MKLQFIGTEGSMNLKHGEVYEVHLSSLEEVIMTHIRSFDCSFYRPHCPAKMDLEV